MARAVVQRHVERDEIGFGEKRVERAILRAQFALDLGRNSMAAGINHAHAKTLRAARDGLPDSTESDDAERFAEHVGAAKLIEIPREPFAGARERIGFDDAARDGEQQRPRQVSRGFVENAGRVGARDLAAAERGEVEIVIADGDVGDDAQARRGGQQRFVDAVGEQRDEALGAGHAALQFFARGSAGAGPEFRIAMRGELRARRFKQCVCHVDARTSHFCVFAIFASRCARATCAAKTQRSTNARQHAGGTR